MIDLDSQHHHRFHLHGLSGNVLDTSDPANTADFDAASLRSSALRFRGQQPSFQFNNETYQYERQAPAMQEAAHVLSSSFDFDAVNVMLADPSIARRDAARDLMVESISPESQPQLSPVMEKAARLS